LALAVLCLYACASSHEESSATDGLAVLADDPVVGCDGAPSSQPARQIKDVLVESLRRYAADPAVMALNIDAQERLRTAIERIERHVPAFLDSQLDASDLGNVLALQAAFDNVLQVLEGSDLDGTQTLTDLGIPHLALGAVFDALEDGLSRDHDGQQSPIETITWTDAGEGVRVCMDYNPGVDDVALDALALVSIDIPDLVRLLFSVDLELHGDAVAEADLQTYRLEVTPGTVLLNFTDLGLFAVCLPDDIWLSSVSMVGDTTMIRGSRDQSGSEPIHYEISGSTLRVFDDRHADNPVLVDAVDMAACAD
jgi:hypothetical protein